MSDNIPLHLRITGLAPTNDDVDSRRSAVLELSATWGKSRPSEKICGKAAEIAESLGGEGVPSPDLGNEVQVAVQKHASAFLYADRPLEVGVCAGMAAVKIVGSDPGTSGWTVADVFSTALWSVLSFQPALLDEKRETLRREVLDAARSRSLSGAEKARERVAVADPVELVVTVTEGKPITTNFKKAIVNQFENLRRNTALDREELDFLWWSLLNRSKLLNKPLADIDEAVRLVALGVEAAGYLRRLPAQVHRDLVLRTCTNDCELDLIELVDRIGADRGALVDGITINYVNKFPAVFPLLNAIVSGQAVGPGASTKRKLSVWGGRALVEAGLSRMMATGVISE